MTILSERPWRMRKLRRPARLSAHREGLVSVAVPPETVTAYFAERAASMLSPATFRIDRTAIPCRALKLDMHFIRLGWAARELGLRCNPSRLCSPSAD